MTPRVYLIGFMGSGKTTIGKFLAHDLKWQYVDMDHLFESEKGCSISQYFSEYGEENFRKEETLLLERVSTIPNAVISTGGGTPCNQHNIEIMKKTGVVVYINVTPENLSIRLQKAKNGRPLLENKTGEELTTFIREKLTQREEFYRQANIITDGENVPFSTYRTLIELCPYDEIN
ncbi:MAG: shikimate kinase [Marinilabiliaceae bacterium]|nr:shikimate kinase [Marinilabiliaceae bacterium]